MINMKIGIEFEMAIYYNTDAKLNLFLKNCSKYLGAVGYDGSLNTECIDGYCYRLTRELRTRTFNNLKLLKNRLDKVFINPEGYTLSINESGGDIRIDFNHSTGTHIHYSSKMLRKKTIELSLFKDEELIKGMLNEIISGTTFPTVKQGYSRGYYCAHENFTINRTSAINFTDIKHHGTVEFRLFNLHGIKIKDFHSALFEQIHLMIKSIHNLYSKYTKNKSIALIKENKLKELNKDISYCNDFVARKEREILTLLNHIKTHRKELAEKLRKKELLNKNITRYKDVKLLVNNITLVKKQLSRQEHTVNKLLSQKDKLVSGSEKVVV